jgi:hypothetical protein
VSEDKKDHNSALHLLEVFPLSIVFDTSFTSTKAPQPSTQNGNFEFPQAVSLFLAGAWGSHVGSFVQVTYDAQADHFSWDNTDIRAAATNGKLFGKQLTYGLTMNNNPTVEDLWNSTPAWGFPFVSSNVAPGPTAGAVINGGLAQDVAGVGGYTMWDDHLYFAGTLYRSEHLGASQPNHGTCCSFNIRGMAPYWRLAYQTSTVNNNVEVGTYGMHMKSTPGAISGLEDSYTDWAVDLQFDRAIPHWKNEVLSIRGTYIRENSSLVASAAAVPPHRRICRTSSEYSPGRSRVPLRQSRLDDRWTVQRHGNRRPNVLSGGPSYGQFQWRPYKPWIHSQRRLVAAAEHWLNCTNTPAIHASTAEQQITTAPAATQTETILFISWRGLSFDTLVACSRRTL